jgi:hypothetical protein
MRWIHEIKHDGYRLIIQRDGKRVCLFIRNGHDWSDRFPLITEAARCNRNNSFVPWRIHDAPRFPRSVSTSARRWGLVPESQGLLRNSDGTLYRSLRANVSPLMLARS